MDTAGQGEGGRVFRGQQSGSFMALVLLLLEVFFLWVSLHWTRTPSAPWSGSLSHEDTMEELGGGSEVAGSRFQQVPHLSQNALLN